MNLISCDSCATVFDKNKLVFPDEESMYDEKTQRVNLSKAAYSSKKQQYVPKILCKVCGEAILDDE